MNVGKDRCFFLMLSLILLLLIYHYVFVQPFLILSLIGISLIAGVYAVSDTKRHVVIAAILGSSAVAFILMTLFHYSVFIDFLGTILLSIFYVFTLSRILLYVIRGRVTRDRIYGAISVYFLIGLAWAPLYRMVHISEPDAFSGTPQIVYSGVHYFDYVYYSFVSLCTLGFGDIVPVSGLARSLTMLEAITGILYMAVLVSRLVSLYRTDREE